MSTYNGWTNQATWMVNLHMTNSESDYRYWTEITTECVDEHGEGADEYDRASARYDLACRMRDDFTDSIPEQFIGTMWQDFLQSYFDDVNFDEIAASWIATDLENR